MARLRAIPVRRVTVPRYPTREEVLSDPRLLREHVPTEWLGQKEVAGALGVFLAANALVMADDAKPAATTQPAPRGETFDASLPESPSRPNGAAWPICCERPSPVIECLPPSQRHS